MPMHSAILIPPHPNAYLVAGTMKTVADLTRSCVQESFHTVDRQEMAIQNICGMSVGWLPEVVYIQVPSLPLHRDLLGTLPSVVYLRHPDFHNCDFHQRYLQNSVNATQSLPSYPIWPAASSSPTLASIASPSRPKSVTPRYALHVPESAFARPSWRPPLSPSCFAPPPKPSPSPLIEA